jgi:hypothetical protein
MFYLSHSNPIPRTEAIITSYIIKAATFSSFSVKNLRSNENECIPQQNEKDFGEEYFEFCLLDSIYDLFNRSFGCIAISHLPFILIDIF